MDETGGNSADANLWARNTDQTRFGWVAEVGLVLSVGGIVVTGGYASRQLEESVLTFGAGFSL